LLIVIGAHDIPLKTEFEAKPKVLFESINLIWVGAEGQDCPNQHANVNSPIDSIDFGERKQPMPDSSCQSVHKKQYL
jgi:hypothetical protein